MASTRLTVPLDWQNTTLLDGDVPTAVDKLKADADGDLAVLGSTELVSTLVEHGLVDAFRLMIDPVLLGGGKRIFRDDGALRPLRIADSEITTTGAVLATYTVDAG